MRDQDMASARLFFAVGPGGATRDCIAGAADALRLDDAARIVRPEHFHLTLAFIGEVPAARLASIRKIGAEQRAPTFALHFDAYEYWPKSQVIVAAAREIPATLESLWQQLHAALAKLSLALNPKRLRPHVTLARQVAQAPVLPGLPVFDWRVECFSLMRSDTIGSQSIYTVVDTWQLLDGAAKS